MIAEYWMGVFIGLLILARILWDAGAGKLIRRALGKAAGSSRPAVSPSAPGSPATSWWDEQPSAGRFGGPVMGPDTRRPGALPIRGDRRDAR